MNDKDGKNLLLNIVIFAIVLVLVAIVVFYQQSKSYQKEIEEQNRKIEIFKKESQEEEKVSENYAKKLSQAKKEIDTVKKDTNYKGYNELSEKEQDKILDKYNEGSSKYDSLVLINKEIRENKDIEKPRIVEGDDGIGHVEVPKGMLDEESKEKIIESIQGEDTGELTELEEDVVEGINESAGVKTPTNNEQATTTSQETQPETSSPTP